MHWRLVPCGVHKGIALIMWEEKVRAPKHTHLFEAGPSLQIVFTGLDSRTRVCSECESGRRRLALLVMTVKCQGLAILSPS